MGDNAIYDEVHILRKIDNGNDDLFLIFLILKRVLLILGPTIQGWPERKTEKVENYFSIKMTP